MLVLAEIKQMHSRSIKSKTRQHGHTFVEFSVALTILLAFIGVLSALCILPIRVLIANGVFLNAVQYAALSETRTSASALLDDAPLASLAGCCGISFGDPSISIVCANQTGSNFSASGEAPVPTQWLPGGANGPCTYALHVDQSVTINPLFRATFGLPGVTSTLSTTLHADCCWENLGCDPTTNGFYLNE